MRFPQGASWPVRRPTGSFKMMAVCALAAGLALAACTMEPTANEPVQPLSAEATTTAPLSTSGSGSLTQVGTTQMPPSPTTPADPGLQDLIDKAIADLAQRLSISATQIKLVDATPVVWSDSSLGCPQPGMAYIQVPEDGLLIRLQVTDQIYPYHSGGFRDPFLCEQVYKDPNAPSQIDFFNLTPSKPGTSSTPDNSIPPGGDN